MNRHFLSIEKAKPCVKILGIIQLVIGFSILWLAPVEIYSFYLFSEGGPFYYDGFHIGSFVHGLVAAQIFAFYAIGVMFILIGYGHIKLKAWTLNLSIGSIWFWIIFGLPVMFFFLPLLSMKEISAQYPILLLAGAAIILIFIIPVILLFFYHQSSVRELFTVNHDHVSEFKNMPTGSYLALIVYSFYILLFHIMIFYHGLFPLFGKFLTGLGGIAVYGFLILLMILLIYGLIKRINISWVISVAFFGLLMLSATVTIINYDYNSIIELMELPKLEYDMFTKLPVKAFYLLLPIVYILMTSLIIVFRTRNYHDIK